MSGHLLLLEACTLATTRQQHTQILSLNSYLRRLLSFPVVDVHLLNGELDCNVCLRILLGWL